MLVRRIARPLLSTIFIAGGIDALKDPAGKAQAAAPLIDKSAETLPSSVTQKVPSDNETLVKINAGVQIGGGVLLAIGKVPRIASLALAGSLIPTTLAGHDFWNETDPAQRAAQQMHFLKNVSLLGGLLITAVDTEGKPSLGWRGRRAARNAQASLASALPSGNSDDHSRAENALTSVSERARKLGEEAAERAPGIIDSARERGSVIAKTAAEKGSELVEVAKDRAPELAETAREKGSGWASVAAEKGGQLASTAAERREALGQRAHDHGDSLGKRARKRAEIARKEGDLARVRARTQAEVALAKARAERAKLAR
ncbi:MAG: DoxX family membrane protein [Rhodococcus sp.]|nr:DoxX family membrane protein [Rhodococcus sp. (in: high G+C Gram-positive bacteria)]